MKKGYFTPPVLIILAIIIFAVAILIAINTDLVKRLKKVPSPISSPSPTTANIEEPIKYSEVTNESCAGLKASSFTVKCPVNWEIEYSSKGSTFITKDGGVADVVITADNGTIITLHKVCQGCFEVNVPAKELEIFVNGEKKKAFEIYSNDSDAMSWWLTGTDQNYFQFDVNKKPPPTEKERSEIIQILSTFQFLN